MANITNVEAIKIAEEYLLLHFERAKTINAALILDNFNAICPI